MERRGRSQRKERIRRGIRSRAPRSTTVSDALDRAGAIGVRRGQSPAVSHHRRSGPGSTGAGKPFLRESEVSMGTKFIAAATMIVAAVFCTAAITYSQTEGKAHIMFTPSTVSWAAAPPSLPPGAQAAVLEGDPSKAGPFTMRVKMPDAYRIAPHYHPADEHVTVLQGALM